MSERATSTTSAGTRQALIEAAVDVFSRVGFDAASMREIESSAGVSRGLGAHHFGSREALWQASVDWLMERFHDELTRHREALADVSPAERARVLLKVYVRFHARHPELVRVLSLSGSERSPRIRWLADEYSARIVRFYHRLTGFNEALDVRHALPYYLVSGAASYIFAVPGECELLFGVDPNDPRFVEAFAEVVSTLFSPGHRHHDPISEGDHTLAELSRNALRAHGLH